MTEVEARRRRWAAAITIWFIADLIGYTWGYNDGTKAGVKLAHAENSIRTSQYDLDMQRVGVCKWAKIMQEDLRCKQELP